jgi:membrane protein YqaA with SNARE-associated domain
LSQPVSATRWRVHLARLAGLVLVVVFSGAIYYFAARVENIEIYGYPGVFLLSFLANATIIFPAPGVAVAFAMGNVLNPLGVALAAGAGAALGEMTGYLAGYTGQGLVPHNAVYQRLERLTQRHGGWAILVLALIPNPAFDIAGAVAGAMRMPVVTFLLFAFAGKTLKMLIIALAGAYSLDWLVTLLGRT